MTRLLEWAALESRAAASFSSSSSGSDLTALRFLPATAEARARPDLDRVVRLAPAAAVVAVVLLVAAAAVAADADERPLLAPPLLVPVPSFLPSPAAVRLAAFPARLPKAPALPRRVFPLPAAPPAAVAAALSSWTAEAGSAAPPVDDLVFLRVSMMMVWLGLTTLICSNLYSNRANTKKCNNACLVGAGKAEICGYPSRRKPKRIRSNPTNTDSSRLQRWKSWVAAIFSFRQTLSRVRLWMGKK